MTPSEIFDKLGLWKWWEQNNGKGTNSFDGVAEKGIDYARNYGDKIGAIASGTVTDVIHNNNAINDIVIIKGNTGYWLYQHITAAVHVGQNINVGTVVGTQNGLPIDQYSTGSHIEVRYASQWIQGLNQWYQNWLNPIQVFNKTASTDVAAANIATVTSGTNGANPLDITGSIQQFINDQINSMVSPIETNVSKALGITGLVVISALCFYFGIVLLTGKDITDVSAYAARQASSKKAVLEKVAVLAA